VVHAIDVIDVQDKWLTIPLRIKAAVFTRIRAPQLPQCASQVLGA